MTLRRRALLIGINYTGTRNELKGCVNDVNNMASLLRSHGYSDIVMLKDSPCATQPTRANMIAAMQSFVSATADGDCLFFHYSGHGTHTIDMDGDEEDGQDEAICPVDGGTITDDELRSVLINPLPQSVSMNMLLDCCHSGTGMDLRYNFEDVAVLKSGKYKDLPDEYDPSDWISAHRRRHSFRTPETRATVLCISGCMDDQTSADTCLRGKACGALTAVFTDAWDANHTGNTAPLTDLFQAMCCMLRCMEYSQRPQLSIGNRPHSQRYDGGTALFSI